MFLNCEFLTSSCCVAVNEYKIFTNQITISKQAISDKSFVKINFFSYNFFDKSDLRMPAVQTYQKIFFHKKSENILTDFLYFSSKKT